MSNVWWQSARSTQGHGIYSQYKPDHLKEWTRSETRQQGRSASPDKTFNANHSHHRSTLFQSHAQPIEDRHNANAKSLGELKQYQSAPPSGNHAQSVPMPTSKVVLQPLDNKYKPHLTHNHHFGWNPPTPKARYAEMLPQPGSKGEHIHYGMAQNWNQKAHFKAAAITSRRV